MTRYLVHLEYDGTGLIGWQENHQGPSVQSLVQDAIKSFCGANVNVVGCGRTDAGVHALSMPAHFDLPNTVPPQTVMRALNFYLANSAVTVLDCVVVSSDFNARFSCVGRHYEYVVLNRNCPPVLDKNRVWWVPRKLNVAKMRHAAKLLVGRHDFTSFRATECQAKSPIKTLDVCDIRVHGEYIVFEFFARSFLHHMVRNIVGTLIEIGLDKPYDVNTILDAKSRAAAGPTAPASGLYFVSGDYANADLA